MRNVRRLLAALAIFAMLAGGVGLAKILKDVVLERPPAAHLQAVVLQVIG